MEDDGDDEMVRFEGLAVPLAKVNDAAEETLLLWCLQQPLRARQNAFVNQSALKIDFSAAGHDLVVRQAPSSLGLPGVTGSVLWDSAVVLSRFLEYASDSGVLQLKDKKCVELGAGCGLLGCVAAHLGAHVTLTDLPDRLRLLQKNVNENVVQARGSARVQELIWGDGIDEKLVDPTRPDFVVASDVVYDDEPIQDLLHTLKFLCHASTLVFIAGELRNDAVLEYFLKLALEDFAVGRLPQEHWHPMCQSQRVVIFVLQAKQCRL